MTARIARRLLAAASLVALGCNAAVAHADAPAPAAASADAAQPTGKTGWGFPVYDVPAEPDVRYGVLPDGMKYAIMHNATPKGTVAVRMGFDVGFVDETPAQAGLAHFLEHMAFNGSAHIPEGDLVKLLEREGLAFGADTNASTGFDQTIYQLDLPRNDPALLGTALMIMRETASELTLAPAAINRERGVIQSENRTRNTFARRRIKDYLDFIVPHSSYSQKLLAANTDANVDSFKPDVLKDLYRSYYRPDNATLVVVGDIDPAAVEAKIKSDFASWANPASPLTKPGKGDIDFSRGPAARNFVDPGVPVIVAIDRFQPYVKEPATVAQFRQDLLLDLGTAIFNRRIQKIANAPGSAIIGGGASASDFFDVAKQASITIQAKDGPDSWKDALKTGAEEMHRMLQYGVTKGELKEQLANFATKYRNAAEQQDTRRNQGLADGILDTVQDQDIFVAPKTEYALFQQALASLTPEAVDAAMRAQFAGSGPLVHVSTKTPVAGGDAAILAAYQADAAAPVSAPKEAVETAFGYTNFGMPGKIVSDKQVADLGFREIRFANNVRLNLKHTDFEQGKVRYLIRLGSGQLTIPKDQSAIAVFTGAMSAAEGTGKHSFDDLQQILAGRQIQYGIGVSDDAFQISGTTTMTDLPLQFDVSAAYVSDPGYRPEALTRWQALVPPFLAQVHATPQGIAQFEVPRIVANGDPRFGMPGKAALEAVTLPQVKQVLSAQLAKAPIEISVVGAIDEQQVIDAVAKSFGALPAREAELGTFTAARQASYTHDTAPVTLHHGGAADQALVQVYWPTTDDSNPQRDATLSLLAQVMELQLLDEVRERLGATYSPGASSDTSDTYTGYGTMSASIVVAPKDAKEVFDAVDTIAAGLRDKPIDADTLNRAKRPLLEKIVLNRRENGWWLQALGQAQLRADRLDRYRTIEARVKAVTPAMLQAAAKEYLTGQRDLKVSILPEAGAKPKP